MPTVNPAIDRLRSKLEERKSDDLFRSRHTLQSAQGASVLVDGVTCINFCSNDYLGLANHPKIKEAFKYAADQYGVGSGASHLVCGHSHEHHLLEEELAEFTGRDRAVLFSTGYMANLGAINALAGKGDAIFEDKLNHASLIDGGLASSAQFYRYAHNDLTHLEQRLLTSNANLKLIVTDGVFSMDGDVAELEPIKIIAEKKSALLFVDDAHGFGVLGSSGGGLVEQEKLTQNDVPVLMGTLGKAFGSFGAFVAGSDVVVESLIQYARTYIYTTALPPAVAAASRASLKLVIDEQWRRDHLMQLVLAFRLGCENLGLHLMPSKTAIQPLVIGKASEALFCSQKLLERGFWVSAIRPPTVAKNTSRLRFTFSAAHSLNDIERLLDALSDLISILPSLKNTY